MQVELARGAPLAPDVELVREAIGVPSRGAEIEWYELSEATGYPIRSSRLRAVVRRWREELYADHGLLSRIVPGYGVRILLERERANASMARLDQGARRIRAGAQIARETDLSLLSPEDARRATRVAEIAVAVEAAASDQVRILLRRERALEAAHTQPRIGRLAQ